MMHTLALPWRAWFGDPQIDIVISLGSHSALKRDEIILKVGQETAQRVRVENHDCQRERHSWVS